LKAGWFMFLQSDLYVIVYHVDSPGDNCG
jgi:hypothetical protein